MADNDSPKDHLTAYDLVLKVFQMNNDNYFKRTQILMIVIQSALFIGFTKLAWEPKLAFDPNNNREWLLLISLGVIPIIGMLSAWVWFRLITKQGDYLEFCRCYLRDIECHLDNLGIHLGYFRDESKVFYRGEAHDFRWSEERFPHREGHREGRGIFRHKVKGRLINIEKWISLFIAFLWAACLFGIGYLRFTSSTHNIIRRSDMVTAITIALAFVQLIVAVLVLIFIGKQTAISKEQANISRTHARIMEGQSNLSREIDESSKAVKMLEKYGDLSESRELLWSRADYFYRAGFKDYMNREFMATKVDGETAKPPETFHDFVNDYIHFPDHYDPTKGVNLLKFIQDHQKAWEHSWIWLFAKFVYDAPGIPEDLTKVSSSKSHEELSQARRDLVYFWDMWSSVLDVCEYVQPDPLELLMLTWLEFALLLKTNDQSGRPGKIHLFKLAKERWKAFEKIRNQA